jgi:hypothetical protein
MYVCMYVCMFLSQPTRTKVSPAYEGYHTKDNHTEYS